MGILLDDEEIMDVLFRASIKEFAGEREGLEQWESRLQWKQRRDLVKAQLKKVKEELSRVLDEPDDKLRLALGYVWQALLDELEEE